MIKKNEIYLIVKISIYITIMVGIFNFLYGTALDLNFALKSASYGVTISLAFWGIFFSAGWKWYPLKWLINRPNLNGTWEGSLTSNWQDGSGNGVGPKKIFVVIRQTFLSIHFVTFTDTFIGTSYAETLVIDKERGVLKAIYVYRKESSDYSVEAEYQGVSELRILEPNASKMEGKFWTSIKTDGGMQLVKLNRNTIATYAQGLSLIAQ